MVSLREIEAEPAQRVTRSFRHRDMGTIQASGVPSFSVGSGGGGSSRARGGGGSTSQSPPSSSSTAPRRSTRRAAREAAAKIAEELAPSRRSARSAARGARGGRAAASAPLATPRRTAARGTNTKHQSTPLVLDSDLDRKPAAQPSPGALKMASASPAKPPADFACAICLDRPPSLTDVAKVDACPHRFCFDCIDRWAGTENKCPCCKARFHRIERVESLPPTPATERRGKRKREAERSGSSQPRTRRRIASPPGGERESNASSSSRANLSPAARARSNRRINARAVEDRTQQSLTAFPINAAIIEQILAQFARQGGPLGGASGRFTLATGEDGAPRIRMVRPGPGLDGIVGVMELNVGEAEEGGGGSAAAGGGRRGRASAGGSPPRRAVATIRFRRAPPSGGDAPSRGRSASPRGAAGNGPPPLEAVPRRSSSASPRGRSRAREQAQRPQGGLSDLASGTGGVQRTAAAIDSVAADMMARSRGGRRARTATSRSSRASPVDDAAIDEGLQNHPISFLARSRSSRAGPRRGRSTRSSAAAGASANASVALGDASSVATDAAVAPPPQGPTAGRITVRMRIVPQGSGGRSGGGGGASGRASSGGRSNSSRSPGSASRANASGSRRSPRSRTRGGGR